MHHESSYEYSTNLVRPLRPDSTQPSAHCLLVQLLQGRPVSAASHLTLRARQGTHALLTLRARFPVSPALCGSLPEAEVFIEEGGAFVVAYNSVDDQGIEGLPWWSDGVFLYVFEISAFKLQVGLGSLYNTESTVGLRQ